MTTISHGGLRASINPKGAELISLTNQSGREFIWEGNPAFWGKHSPVLFPIVGTLKGNTYTYADKSYSLPRHGFARDLAFEPEHTNGTSAAFVLRSDENTLKIYPFDFEFRIIYTLTEAGLEIAYRVSNMGNETQYFSLGAHPAFALPEKFTDYALEIHTEGKLVTTLLENDLISDHTTALELQDNKLPLDYTLFAKDALIFKNTAFKNLILLENQKPLLQVDFEDFPDLGLWTKAGAPFLCIEPWFGYSDSASSEGNIEEKPGIIALRPAADFNARFTINPLQ